MEEMPSQRHALAWVYGPELHPQPIKWIKKTCLSCSLWSRGNWVFRSWDANSAGIWESSDQCFFGAAWKTDWSNRPQQKPKGKVRYDKGAKRLRSWASFAVLVSCWDSSFIFLWAEPFVRSAHINALGGLVIIHTCHLCHLHSRTHGQQREEQNNIEQDQGASFEF